MSKSSEYGAALLGEFLRNELIYWEIDCRKKLVSFPWDDYFSVCISDKGRLDGFRGYVRFPKMYFIELMRSRVMMIY